MSFLVSVIITTKNEEAVIKRLLSSLRRQSYKNIEILLIDNNSSDATKAIAKRFTNKIYNFGPERSAQRNYGAKISKGKYIIFLDADMELSPNILKECVEVCEKDLKIGGVVIPEQSKGTTFWEKVKGFERSFYNREGDEAIDAARFFTRQAFNKVNGYDETITGPEDWDLPETIRKSGYKIAGRINSKIYHYEEIDSLFDLARKKFYYALSSHRYLSKHHISTFSPKTIYFLRPVFYRHFGKILAHPILSLGMILMLSLELVGGGLGYTIGRIKKL